MSKPRITQLPQHHYNQGHYGELPLNSLPSGTHTGHGFTYLSSTASWGVDYPMLLREDGVDEGRIFVLDMRGPGVDVQMFPSGVAHVTIASGGGSGTDEKVKVSSNDTTAEYLFEKLVAGTNVTLVENNNGGDESITIQVTSGIAGGIGFAGARAYHSADQSISNATWTSTALNSERFDTDSFHDTSTNNSRMTIPAGKAGKYLVGGVIEWLANGTGERFGRLLLNGTTIIAHAGSIRPTGTFNTRIVIATVYDLAVGDYVELQGWQDSGAGLNVNSAANYSPEFYIAALGFGTAAKAWLTDNYDPDDYPASPNAVDDEFKGGGSIDAKWTKTNDPAGGDAWDQTTYTGFARVGLVELGTDNVANYILLTQTAPDATATARYRAKVSFAMSGIATDSGEFTHCTVCLIDTANGIAVGGGIQINNVDTGDVLRPTAQHDTGGTSGTMAANNLSLRFSPAQWVYIELRKDTTSAYTSANTYTAWLSSNGIVWEQVGSASATFTATPVLGISIRRPKAQTGTPAGEVAIDFFRKVA